MTTTYVINGMKCEGCAKTVTERFSGVAGVTDVAVDLAKKEATVTGNATKEVLNASLSGTKFSIA